MRTMILLAATLVVLSGCSSPSTAPTPPASQPPSVTAAALTLTASATPDAFGRFSLRISATDASGKGLTTNVHLANSAGILDTDTVVTSGDGLGLASLVTSVATTVTATSGGATAHAQIVPPQTGNPTRSVDTIVASASVSGHFVTFTVAVTAPVAVAAYHWDFGDGQEITTIYTTAQHAYSVPGTYSASVTLTDVQLRTAASAIDVTIAPPPPPPPPMLDTAIACTPAAHGTPSSCTLTARYLGVTLAPAAVTNVDWIWGDVTNTLNGGVTRAHTYAVAGSYLVITEATATTVDGPKTSTATMVIVVP